MTPPVTTSWPELRRRSILAETDSYLALDKPAGLSVTGERHDTDLVRIAGDAGERLYPVHRIDKVTSGVVLLARTLAVHGPLTRQFAARMVRKSYLVITRSAGLPAAGEIDLPLAVGRKNRVRIAAPRQAITFDPATARWSLPVAAVAPDTPSYRSLTTFTRLWAGAAHTVLLVHPHTGRRHQIRVHLAWTGHPIVGDPLFAGPEPASRTALHAWRLAFDDAAGRRIRLVAPPGEDFWTPVAAELSADHCASLLQSCAGLSGRWAPNDHSKPSGSTTRQR